MKASDVTATLELALQASGCDKVNVRHRPRLLSDNGSSYISGDLAEWLEDQSMDQITYGFFRKNNFEEAGSATRS
jgi:transposase InsO family protein